MKNKDIEEKVYVNDISTILIYGKAINVTTNAINLALSNGIHVYLLNLYGKPYGFITSIINPGCIITRREQYAAINNTKGFILAKAFVYSKLKNQERILRLRAKYINGDNSMRLRELADGLSRLANLIDDVSVNNYREELMTLEAKGARDYYWKGFSLLLPPRFEFSAREHRGARDPINSLLNYGYGFLLTRVINAIIISGLDPYAGFLHVDRPGRVSLALDLIEEFRQPVVDYTMLKILRMGKLRDNILDEEGMLNKETLNILALWINYHLHN